MKCYHCNTEMDCKREKYHYTESGLDNVYLEGIEVCRCKKCKEEAVRIPGIMELNDLIGKIIIEKKDLLNGAEIKYLRKNMGFTGKKLSSAMRLDNSTISRWETGKQDIRESHDAFLRLVYCVIKGIPVKEDMEKETVFRNNIPPFIIGTEEIEKFHHCTG